MTPKILLDRAARDELRRLLLGKRRPRTVSPVVWHQLHMGALVAVEIRTLTALSDLVGPDLVERLKSASELSAQQEASPWQRR